jgi:hypothetical protein
MKARILAQPTAAYHLCSSGVPRQSYTSAGCAKPGGSQQADPGARVLAILLLALIVVWALFSNVFRFEHNCARTIGQAEPFGSAYELCDWFTTR